MTIANKARMDHWASASLATAFMLAGSPASAGSRATPLPPKPTASTAAQVQLADQLKDAGVKYYGSWRCPACQYQSNLFGQGGQQRLPYVECAKPDTLPEQARACSAAEIRAYPTWIHPSGERREGVQSLNELQGWIEQP